MLDISSAEIGLMVSRMLGCPVVSVRQVGGGRNSRVHVVVSGDGSSYVAKLYFRDPSDTRDRLSVEFNALTYLRAHGVSSVPEPIALTRNPDCGIYGYVEGDRVLSQDVTDSDIDAAVDFLCRLKQLAAAERRDVLPPASEAFFSIESLLANLSARLERLRAVRIVDARDCAMHDFLGQQLVPWLAEFTQRCRREMLLCGRSLSDEMPRESRTLSPSDFGFHNTLRGPDGQLTFIDFEYFGWDDPAKTISDFLLHPGMELSWEQRHRFFREIVPRFGDSRELESRIRMLYPLFGVKWSLILLNEFLPGGLRRRGFAEERRHDAQELRSGQLDKAKRMLEKVVTEYEAFPYGT